MPALELHNVTLGYRLSRSTAGSFKEFAIQSFKRQVKYERLWALKGVTLTVNRGEVLAVIGPNGAGKSTLLKLMARVLPPSTGRVIVRGRTAPMIELGAGFNPDMTGLENTVLYGTLLGRTPRRMRERAEEIADWAELTEHMDVPVRSYSSGMLARLAFAIAVDVEPDVLLVDEVLSVGDEAFQRKSQRRMDSLIHQGVAVVLVSHNMDHVQGRSTQAMWLDRGQVREFGDPHEVVRSYRQFVFDHDKYDE